MRGAYWYGEVRAKMREICNDVGRVARGVIL